MPSERAESPSLDECVSTWQQDQKANCYKDKDSDSGLGSHHSAFSGLDIMTSAGDG
jgi:hypothetical protein